MTKLFRVRSASAGLYLFLCACSGAPSESELCSVAATALEREIGQVENVECVVAFTKDGEGEVNGTLMVPGRSWQPVKLINSGDGAPSWLDDVDMGPAIYTLQPDEPDTKTLAAFRVDILRTDQGPLGTSVKVVRP